MSKRYPGGLITKTPVTPTTASAPGIWTLDQALQYIKAGTWPIVGGTDPYFPYVTMLLHGDGTNGAQNNTFLDSSTNNFTITRNGNTTQGSFSPYGSNWSNYFDGSGDYLSLPSNAALNIGTGDFTIECFYYDTVSGRRPELWGRSGAIIALFSTNGSNYGALLSSATYGTSGQTLIIQSSVTPAANQWNHVAVVRSGSTITMYLNGVSVGTATNTSSSDELRVIGAVLGGNTPGELPFAGYISNLRIVKGTAVYTSAFTPSTTPLTAIANTSLLTCQSNRFIDNSTNNFTITRNGDVSVQRFSPFSPASAYSTSLIGGSGYFDGSGDYLTFTKATTTSSFTCECWFYRGEDQTNYHIVFGGTDFSNANVNNIQFTVSNTGAVSMYMNNASVIAATGTAVIKNQWNHIAWVRSGTSCAIFVNGSRIGTGTSSAALNVYSVSAYASGYEARGYIADARIVNAAVYDPALTTCTVPTAPLTAIANTYLLCNMTNGGIFDNAMMNDLETVGNAQISTSVVKFGTGSLAFDGTGDYLTSPNSVLGNFGSSNWTIEFWIKSSQTSRVDPIGWNYPYANAGWGGLILNLSASGQMSWYEQTSQRINATSTGWNDNNWNHIAITRSGNSVRMFLNGTQQGSTYTTSASYGSASSNFIIGVNNDGTGPLNGYIDDLRITNGYARYTSNFTPPTAAFPNQ
jgi:hypothetical protein